MQIQPTLTYQIFMPSTFGLTSASGGISSLTRLQKLLIANYWEASQKKTENPFSLQVEFDSLYFPCIDYQDRAKKLRSKPLRLSGKVPNPLVQVHRLVCNLHISFAFYVV